MAELNDKLITYGNLSTFYDKLQEQGLGDNAIEEVSELPEASENKDKLFRLDNGEKDVYAAKLLSSTVLPPTNRLPDEQQIDKAYLYDGDVYYYKGAYKIVCSDGEIDGYLWGEYIISLKNAEIITQDSGTIYYVDDGGVFDDVNKTITFDTDLASFKSENEDTYGFNSAGVNLVYAIYNAPESAQIGNATFTDDNEGYIGVTYTGEEFIKDGITYYKWLIYDNNYVTNKKASDIYYILNSQDNSLRSDVEIYEIIDNDLILCDKTMILNFYIPQLNAPDSEQVGHATITVKHSRKIDGVWKEVEDVFTYIGTLSAMDYDNAEVETYYAYENEEINSIVGTEIAPSDMYNLNQFEGEVKSFYPIPNPDFSEDMWMPDYGWPTDFSTVKYQRTETTEEWGWEKVATEDDINNLSDELSLKANKVDYTVPMTLDTETYEYVPDYNVLNSATIDGSYSLKYIFNQSNVDTTVVYGNLQVSQGGRLQTIHYFDGILTYTMRMNQSNQWITTQEFTIPSIWQSNIGKSNSSYSAEKVDELISALEARIAALEGNTTTE